MATNLTKKAAEMLMQGAVLLGQPCPYCSGVRVMKDGHALCISCGRQPEKRNVPNTQSVEKPDLKMILEEKMTLLSEELKKETDHAKQQDILKSINSILDALDKLKNS